MGIFAQIGRNIAVLSGTIIGTTLVLGLAGAGADAVVEAAAKRKPRKAREDEDDEESYTVG